MEELITRIFEKLKKYFESDENFNESLLLSIVTEKTDEVKTARKYPEHYTEEMILTDLNRFESNIYQGSKLAYAKVGAEGETSHGENGTSRSYEPENAYLNGVVPLSVTY